MEGAREERILSYWICKKHMFMSVSGLHTMAVIGNGILHNWGDWGTEMAPEAIGRASMPVHIVGMFFFKNDANDLLQLLSLLSRNVSDVQFSHYRVITPVLANLPSDVLQAIPYEGIQNSKTGRVPEDLLHQIGDIVGGTVTSARDSIYCGLVAVGNLIEHAAEIVAQFAMKLLDATKKAIQTVVEVVKKLVDAIIGWAEDMLVNAYKFIVNTVKSAVNDLMEGYKSLITTLARWFDDARVLVGELGRGVAEFMNGVTKVAMITMGVFLGAMAVIIAIKAATMGIGAFISQLLYQTVLKKVLLTLVLTAALEGTFHDVANLFSEGEDPDSEMGKIVAFVGITGMAVDKLYGVGDTVINFAKNKIGVYGYYIGLILAFSGMLAGSATATLNGDLLIWADRTAIAISAAGLIYSLWLLKRDLSTESHEEASPLIVAIELGIGTCGVVSAIAKYIHDTGGG